MSLSVAANPFSLFLLVRVKGFLWLCFNVQSAERVLRITRSHVLAVDGEINTILPKKSNSLVDSFYRVFGNRLYLATYG